jgi:hypothetical protein
MTKDDIIRMAIEAGGSEVEEADPQCFIGMMAFDVQELERFAALISASEREACAQLCERGDSMRWSGAPYAIRARSQS